MTEYDFTEMKQLYQSGTTQTLQWRLTQLQTLKTLLTSNTSELLNALQTDLNKNSSEGLLSEINLILKEIDLFLSYLESWMEVKQVASPVLLTPCFSEVRYEPKGTCLIIGSCNYPINLTLLPAVGSLASGNPTVIKPSELCIESSKVLSKLITQYFHPSILRVIEGGIPETTSLLKHTWGIILFTGSERVGKIISQSASKTLSPIILELGGKSPTYIDIDCPDMRTVAMRIAWGKLMNVGQTCVAPDYILCHEMHYKRLCEELLKAMERMFTSNPKGCESYPRMATIPHAERQLSLLKDVEGKVPPSSILYGGSSYCDTKERYIHPTIILDPPLNCKLMTEEIFGPIVPIIPISSTDNALQFLINQTKHSTPLAFYVFTTNNATFERFVSRIKSGGVMRNDVILHYANSNVPFGGLGSSGYGCYHGKYSLDAFSHKRAVLHKPAFQIFEFGDLRYHPYSKLTTSVLNLFAKCPDVPNLHTRKLLMLGTLVSFAAIGVRMFDVDVRGGFGSTLRNVADYFDPPV